MKRNRIKLSGAVMAVGLVVTATDAAVITSVNGSIGTFSASAADLMNAGQPTLAGIAFTGTAGFGSHQSNINNGVVYHLGPGTSSVDSLTPSVGSVLTVTFDITANKAGYDIARVVSLTGFTVGGRTDQGYDLEAAYVGSPTFYPLASVSVNSGGPPSEMQVTVTGNAGAPLAIGVEKLRFTFTNAFGDPENMYREIDVFGTPTAPEPSAIALLGLGGWLALRYPRTKRK